MSVVGQFRKSSYRYWPEHGIEFMIASRTHNDLTVVVTVIALFLGTMIVVVELYGFQFTLDKGPFLLATALLILALRMRSWWPAAFLLVQVPFQGLLFQKFGMFANVLSLAAAMAFLTRYPPQRLPEVLLGTRTQRLATLFILGVAIPVVWPNRDLAAIVSFGQKLTLLVIVAAIAHGFGRGQRLRLLAMVTVSSAAAMYALSEIEFYFGSSVIPGFGGHGGVVAAVNRGLDPLELQYRLGNMEVSGQFGPNRFAFLSILPVSLALGIFLTARWRSRHVVWFMMFAVLTFGLYVSGTRAGSLGSVVAIAAIIALLPQWSLRLRVLKLLGVLLAAGVLALQLIPTGVTLYHRIVERDPALASRYSATGFQVDEGRTTMWKLGFEMFLEYPPTGVGLKRFASEAAARRPELPVSKVHSGYLLVLAETGVLGDGAPRLAVAPSCVDAGTSRPHFRGFARLEDCLPSRHTGHAR